MATPIPTNRASLSIDAAAGATRGTLVRRGRDAVAVGFTTDSRAVTTGSAFVALRGATHDGHTFLEGAIAKGAALLVVERGRVGKNVQDACDADVGPSVLEVDDTLVAWGDLARAHLEAWRASGEGRRVVAITGSAGKTTTKELTAALLSAVAPCHFTAGNLNNRIGMPAVVLALEPTHRFVVLEMGMSVPGEISAMAHVAHPDVAVVTNVGIAHAEGVGGREGVMREKGVVYQALSEDGVAVVNVDDEFVQRACIGTRARRVVGYGRGLSADYRLVRREAYDGGSRMVVARPSGEIALHLPLPGEVAALDLIAALAAQEAASGVVLPAGRLDEALAGVRLAGRASLRRLAGDTLVLDDTYNANPSSMRAALAALAEIAGARRRVAVLGEMKELGDHARAEHVALGTALVDAGVALAIGCGGLADLALDEAARRGIEVVRGASAEAVAREITGWTRSGDAILIKASRSVGAERVVEALVRSLGSLPDVEKSASSTGTLSGRGPGDPPEGRAPAREPEPR